MKQKYVCIVGFLFVVVVGLQLTVLAQGNSSQPPSVVRASCFELTDEKGKVILTLSGTTMKDNFVAALVQFSDVTRPVLQLQKAGDNNVTLCASTANGTIFRINLTDNLGSNISWSNENDKYSMSMGLLTKDVPHWNLKSGNQVKDLGDLKK